MPLASYQHESPGGAIGEPSPFRRSFSPIPGRVSLCQMSPRSVAIVITLGLLLWVCLNLFRYAFKYPSGGPLVMGWGAVRIVLLLYLLSRMMRALNAFARYNDLPDAGIATWLLAWVASVFVHELGHLVAAKAVGFRISLFSVGPFALQRSDAGWKPRFDLTIMRRAMGMVSSTPRSSDSLRSNRLFTTAAGPAASLLFALAALRMLLGAPGLAFERFGYGFGVCVILSLLTFVQALLPTRGFHPSDGSQILTLLRGGPAADRLCGSPSVYDKAVRPRDWDEAWVAALVAEGQSIQDLVSGYTLAYAHALDAGNIARAGEYLDRLAEYTDRLPAGQMAGVFFEMAYFEARHRNNARKAREYLDRAAGLSRADPYAIPRCQAAVLLVEGSYSDAERALEEARSALSRIGQTGDALAEWDLVRDLELQLAARRRESGTS